MNSEANTRPDSNPLLPFPPRIIGIAGASGSGKTTLAVELARELDGVYFPIDNYYRDLSHLPFSERVKQNFDDPALIESSLLASHVAAEAKIARCRNRAHDPIRLLADDRKFELS